MTNNGSLIEARYGTHTQIRTCFWLAVEKRGSRVIPSSTANTPYRVVSCAALASTRFGKVVIGVDYGFTIRILDVPKLKREGSSATVQSRQTCTLQRIPEVETEYCT